MAEHDCNDAFDPSFFDPVLVDRIDETIDSHGRVIRAKTRFAASAVVLATSPNDLQRLPEEEYMLKSISLYSPFRFQGPAQDPVGGARQHPDEVIWHGNTYVVRLLDDYTPYGRGFTHAIAVSIDAVDEAPYAAGHA